MILDSNFYKMEKRILTSKDVMRLLGICENTLLKMVSDGRIKVDLRIRNRKNL